MLKNRKKIGVITSEIDNECQKKILLGIQKEAYSRDYDVLVFFTFVKGHMWNDYQNGEMNVFSLINYDKLDGVIVLPDQLVDCTEALENIELMYRQRPNDIVSLGYQVEGVTSISDVSEQGFKDVLEHLTTVHGVRDIACMTGFKGHPHAEERLGIYRNFMKEKGLPIKENRIFYGDFWYDCGEQVVEELVNCPEGMPQAICCVSDTMGLSVYDACMKRGIRVPENVIVTGFDTDGGGIVKPYFLTSAQRDAESIGVNAARKLINQLEDENLPEVRSKGRFVIGQTCGCDWCKQPERERFDLQTLKDQRYYDFFTEYNFMMEDGIGADGMTDYLWKMDWYTKFLVDMAGFYVCLCDDWAGEGKSDNDFRRKGFSNKLNLTYSRYHEEKQVDLDYFYDKAQMLPNIWEEREEPCTFWFASLHFMGRCFGAGVLQYEGEPRVFPDYYWGWMRNFCNLLETMRRYINMEKVYSCLSEAYRLVEMNALVDSLTGLYNRNGFNKYAKDQIDMAKQEGSDLTVVMADLNELKYINDTFGHTEGDFAIREAGKAMTRFLKRGESEHGRCYRIGGDEYTVIFGENLKDEEITSRIRRIEDYLNEVNEKSKKPYNISLSIGYSRENPLGRNLDQVILKADKRMYEAKKIHKEEKKDKHE